MPLCPAGSSPKPGAPATYWVTSQDIQSWVGADTYSRLAPWVWNLAEQLIAVDELCAGDPPQPPTISDTDVLLASSNPISAIGFANRLTDFAKWWVWSQQCQCNPESTCATSDIDVVWGQNLQFNPSGPGFVWPTQHPGTSSVQDFTYYPWPEVCPNVDITIWMGTTSTPGQPQLVTSIQDCSGTLYQQSHICGQPQPVELQGGTCANGGPGIRLVWLWSVDPSQYPDWHIRIANTGTPPSPTPAPPPDQITITVEPYPTPPCSTIGDICSIIWNIKNYQTTIQNNTYVNSAPTQYTEGNSYTISGQGEQAVASGTRGLAVVVTANPPNLDPRPDDPAEYWNLGWLRTGNEVGWDRKAWIRTSGQRVFPPWSSFDKFAWTLAEGVTLTVTELVGT
jgi:hypothetical protein